MKTFASTFSKTLKLFSSLQSLKFSASHQCFQLHSELTGEVHNPPFGFTQFSFLTGCTNSGLYFVAPKWTRASANISLAKAGLTYKFSTIFSLIIFYKFIG